MARAALYGLFLDEVVLMPCGYPPHKELTNVMRADIRLKMTRLLVKNEEKMTVSDWEIKNEGKSYTAKTLKFLKEQNPNTLFFFIVGADSLCYMDDWMMPELIFENAEIAVLKREGYTDKKVDDYIAFLEKKYGAVIHRVPMERVDVSSSMLREMLDKGIDISQYTGKEIYALISEYINEQRKNN